jgi:hypothetical protein
VARERPAHHVDARRVDVEHPRIDQQTPLRQAPPDPGGDRIVVSSLEGYGVPVIDLGLWFVASDLTAVVTKLDCTEQMAPLANSSMKMSPSSIKARVMRPVSRIKRSDTKIEMRVYGGEGALNHGTRSACNTGA